MQSVVPMTIYTLLKGEHDEVRGLFKLLEASPSTLDGGRGAIFERLRRELLSHLSAEETTVYEPLRGRIDDSEVIDGSEQEHREIRRLVDSLWHVDPETEEWKLQLEALKESVEAHIRKEETELFEEMKDYLTDEESRNMAKEFHRAKVAELEALKQAV
jgi:iron-sulfur cluster repair protein YtfE (RIC family)